MLEMRARPDYVPIFATLRYKRMHPTGIGGVQSVSEHYTTVVAMDFGDDGEFEYITLTGARIPSDLAIGLVPIRPRR